MGITMQAQYARLTALRPGRGFLLMLCTQFAVAAISLFLAWPASGEAVCRSEPLSDPARQAILCGGGFRMEIEAGARATILARRGDARPRTIEVDAGAVLVKTGSGGGRSQIRTPHAIAAVRGTEYVVDVSAAQTSVLVLEGAVDVRGNGVSIGRVRLGPGQGVDVTGEEPLEVRNWPAERVANTLSRFGR